jgi:hypothetical protein
MLVSSREEGCGLTGCEAVSFMTRAKTSKKKQTQSAPDVTGATKTGLTGTVCRDCPEWQTMRQKLRVSELLVKAIEGFESRMKAQDFKPTVAEYLKLLQMEQEMDATEDKPKEIKVTWVDPALMSEPEE